MAVHVTHPVRVRAGARQQLRSVARRGQGLCCSRRWVVPAMQKTHSSFMHSFIAIFSARQLHTTAHMPCFCVHSPKSRISGAHACRHTRAASRIRPVAAQTAWRARTSVASFLRFSYAWLRRLYCTIRSVICVGMTSSPAPDTPAHVRRTPQRQTTSEVSRTVAFLLRCWRCISGRHAPRRCAPAAHRGHAAGCPRSP